MFFFIPDLFTPYIQGREMAIDRNWTDQKNYNQVQKAQLGNLFDLATMSPRVNQEYEKLTKAAYENRQAARKDFANENAMPGVAALAAAKSQLQEQNAGDIALRLLEQSLNPNAAGGGYTLDDLLNLLRQRAAGQGGTGDANTAGTNNANAAGDRPPAMQAKNPPQGTGEDPNAAAGTAGTGTNQNADQSAAIPSILQPNQTV